MSQTRHNVEKIVNQFGIESKLKTLNFGQNWTQIAVSQLEFFYVLIFDFSHCNFFGTFNILEIQVDKEVWVVQKVWEAKRVQEVQQVQEVLEIRA